MRRDGARLRAVRRSPESPHPRAPDGGGDDDDAAVGRGARHGEHARVRPWLDDHSEAQKYGGRRCCSLERERTVADAFRLAELVCDSVRRHGWQGSPQPDRQPRASLCASLARRARVVSRTPAANRVAGVPLQVFGSATGATSQSTSGKPAHANMSRCSFFVGSDDCAVARVEHAVTATAGS